MACAWGAALPRAGQACLTQPDPWLCHRLPITHPLPCSLYDWLLGHAQLGYSTAEEEEAWQLMQQLRALQQQERRAPVAGHFVLPGPAAQAGGAAVLQQPRSQQQEGRAGELPTQPPPALETDK